MHRNTELLNAPAKRKGKTLSPVTGLISSHKQAYVTKKAATELHNPSTGLPQCHRVSHDWLNKNTKSVPASHLGQLRLLKGKGSHFFYFFKSVCLCGSFRCALKLVIHSGATLGMGHITAQWVANQTVKCLSWVCVNVKRGPYFSGNFTFKS